MECGSVLALSVFMTRHRIRVNTGGTILTPYSDQVTYTGLSASSGPGNLTGVSGLVTALKQGDTCAVFVTVNDLGSLGLWDRLQRLIG